MATEKNTDGSNGTEPSPIMKDVIVWDKHNRELVDGDVIRTTVQNPEHESFGASVYGIATGMGFGTSPDLIGGAIYIQNQSFALEVTLERTPNTGKSRWERSWGIEIMRRVRYVICEECEGVMEADFVGDCEEFSSYEAHCETPKCPSGTVYFNIMKNGETDPTDIKPADAEMRRTYLNWLELQPPGPKEPW